MIHLMLVIVSLVSLSGCVKIKDKDEKKAVPIEEPQETFVEEKPQEEIIPVERPTTNETALIKEKLIAIEIAALKEPYQYQAAVFVEHADASMILQKLEIETKKMQVLKYVAGETLIDSVQSGKTYRYQVFDSTDLEKPVDELEVSIPQDLVLKGALNLDENLRMKMRNAKRLFLDKNFTLTTNGQDFLVRLDELIADHALIRTFAPGAVAAKDQKGRAGGKISFYVKKATGNILFELRGENGGPGSAGKSQPMGAAGSVGDGYYDIGIISKYGNTPPSCKITRPPGVGGNGLPGGNGFEGQSGGSTGSLTLNFEEEIQFDFRVERIQSVGGLGGSGGIGGAPGPGGRFKTVILNNACAAHFPPGGKKGADGQAARNGSPGAVEGICVKRGWETASNCY